MQRKRATEREEQRPSLQKNKDRERERSIIPKQIYNTTLRNKHFSCQVLTNSFENQRSTHLLSIIYLNTLIRAGFFLETKNVPTLDLVNLQGAKKKWKKCICERCSTDHSEQLCLRKKTMGLKPVSSKRFLRRSLAFKHYMLVQHTIHFSYIRLEIPLPCFCIEVEFEYHHNLDSTYMSRYAKTSHSMQILYFITKSLNEPYFHTS